MFTQKLDLNVLSNVIRNSQKVENNSTDKQKTVVYPYNETLFSHDTCYDMGKS